MKKLSFAVCLFFTFFSCSKEEVTDPLYSPVPYIEFINLKHENDEGLLKFTISYQDGDADMGLNPSDTTGSFANFIYKQGKGGKYDTLMNPDFNNFMIDILVKNESGGYEKYQFEENTSSFNYRFPRINQPFEKDSPFRAKRKSKWEGELIFNYQVSPGFVSLFSDKSIKFRIYIKDRFIHKSNEIESNEIIIN